MCCPASVSEGYTNSILHMKDTVTRPLLVLPVAVLIGIISLLILFPALRHYTGAPQTVRAQSSDLGSFSGYAWSDNLGWISFSGGSYGVAVKSDGTLYGYAWANPSDDADVTNNIGWISFNAADTASCGTVATLTGTTITGWAKVLSADGNDWNGCISLSGSAPAYGVTLPSGASTSGSLEGYAWADNSVGGWISFNCDTGSATGSSVCATSPYGVAYSTAFVAPPTSITSFTGPTRVRAGSIATLTYAVVSPPATCTVTGVTATTTSFSATVSGAGSSVSSQVYANTLFTLTCSGVSKSTTVGIDPTTIEK
jgi:hypothetical protein